MTLEENQRMDTSQFIKQVLGEYHTLLLLQLSLFSTAYYIVMPISSNHQ